MSETGERPSYANPPIQEGLCQLTFARPVHWSVATPGLLYEQLRAQYPADPEVREQVEASLQVGPAGAGPNFTVNQGKSTFIYKDSGGTRLVVAGPDVLSVNSLRPYEGWLKLKARLEEAYKTFESVFKELPPVSRVALRYINRVEIPPGHMDTDDFFNVVIRTADDGRAPFRGFIQRVESALPDDAVSISTFASMPSNLKENPFLLDLEVYKDGLNLGSLEEIVELADSLKGVENREFESSITDKTRELFI